MNIKRIGPKLIVTDFPSKEGLFALLPLLLTILALLKVLPFSPIYPIAAVLFCLLVLFSARFCYFEFDLNTRKIVWKKLGLLRQDSGSCSFEDVRELVIDYISVQDTSDGKNYRIVLCLESENIPLTDTYQYLLTATEKRIKQVSDFTSIKISNQIVCTETDYVKQLLGRNDRKD